ncbi:MAG: hypothetical protein ACQETQ_07835 [Spirochaetota bacterium]
MHGMFEAIEENILGACHFCAAAFGVREEIKKTSVKLLSDYEGHPSLRRLVADGYQLVTF